MINTIYIKLVRYFIGLIIITCLAAVLLFFFIVGRPMADDFHRLMRNQSFYIAWLTGDILSNNFSADRLTKFLKETSNSYEMDLALLDRGGRLIAGFPEEPSRKINVSEKMLQQVEASGRFVRPGHFSSPTIYVLPVSSGNQENRYLYLSKRPTLMKSYLLFFSGLGAICILLIIAIYPLAKSFTNPITRLSGALFQISMGNFQQEISIESRKDELGDLVRIFKKMSRSVGLMIESKKRLLADISHEIRSPLSRMRISAEMLRDEIGNSNSSRHIDNMEAEIDFMNEMIRSLSVYSKINLPNFSLNKKVVAPSALIDEVYRRYSDMTAHKGLTLVKHIDSRVASVMLDREQITRVLINFMDNAIKHCSPGGEISLEVGNHKRGVCFSVSDSGNGVTEAFADKIFDPLFRADPSRNRDTGGLGLGLAICKKIVELHDGEISYRRENGKTVFSFII